MIGIFIALGIVGGGTTDPPIDPPEEGEQVMLVDIDGNLWVDIDGNILSALV